MSGERILHHIVWNREEVPGAKMDVARILQQKAEFLSGDDQLGIVSVMDRIGAGKDLSERIRKGEVGIDLFGIDVAKFNQDPTSQSDAFKAFIYEHNIEGDAIALLLANDLDLRYPVIVRILQQAGYDASLERRFGTDWILVGRYPKEFSTFAGYDKALIGDAEAI